MLHRELNTQFAIVKKIHRNFNKVEIRRKNLLAMKDFPHHMHGKD